MTASHTARDPMVLAALQADRLVDIVTTGARTGQARRIEIWFHWIDRQVYVCGLPGTPHAPEKRRPRGWLANLAANPRLQFCLKESLQLSLPATARLVRKRDERRRVMTAQSTAWYREQGHALEDLIDNAPMIAISFDR